MKSLRKRVFEIVETAETGDHFSKTFDILIFTLIILNVLSVMIETTVWGISHKKFFDTFELVSVFIFSFEYCLRVWSAVESRNFSNPFKGRVKFILTPFAIIDLIAILPSLLPMIFPIDLRFLRILRLMRIFRIIKLARYTDASKLIYNMFVKQKEELFITLFGGSMLLIISSCLIYYAEYEAQPTAFASIPHSIWWSVCTLTTVGYGDTYPVTTLGKIIASIISVLGIGLFALPAGILASGLMNELNNEKQSSVCPHCGEKIEKDI